MSFLSGLVEIIVTFASVKSSINLIYSFTSIGNLSNSLIPESELFQPFNVTYSNSKLVFISCFYKDQLLTHLDLEILLKTDFSIYSNFTQIIEKQTDLFNTLDYHLKMHPLFMIQSNSIRILEFLKQSK